MLSAIVAAGTAADQGAESPAGARQTAERAPAERYGFPRRGRALRGRPDPPLSRARVSRRSPARTKELLYYLYEAALCGRDIIFDQKYRYNLGVKRTLEQIVRHYPGDRDTADFRALTLYLEARLVRERHSSPLRARQVRCPASRPTAFAAFVRQTPAEFPLREGQSLEELIAELTRVLFDAAVDAKLVSKSADRDVLTSSAVNFYSGLTQREVEAFYASLAVPGDATPVSLGLNSRLVKRRRRAGRGRAEGRRAVHAGHRTHGRLAREGRRRQPRTMRSALRSTKLIAFYRSGSLEDWDDYNIAWLRDTESHVDLIHGFIEVYNDPLGMRGTFESVVSFRDPEATRRIGAIAGAAQWFEDHMPFFDRHKKPNVTGITGKVITVVIEAGDAAPTTPIGINLPNCRLDPPRARLEIGEPRRTSSRPTTPCAAESTASSRTTPAEIERNERYGELAAALARRLARGHRPRLGAARARRRSVARDDEELRLDARGSARRSRGAVFRGRSEARRARPDAVRRGRPCRLRSLHPQRDCCSS